MRSKNFILFIGLMACGGAGARQPGVEITERVGTRPDGTKEPRIDAIARELIDSINARDDARRRKLYTKDMLAAIPPEDERPFTESVLSKGDLTATKRIDGGDRHAVYDVDTRHGAGSKLRIELDIDDAGQISGYVIRPMPIDPPLEKSKVPLGLPFRGQWRVFWGGDNPTVNVHVVVPIQRRAADLDKVDAQGKDHSGDGKQNTDFFAYGSEVLAVADGVVVEVVDGVPDNVPGKMNPAHLGGNEVLIRHSGVATIATEKDTPEAENKGNRGLYSFYAHLQRDKIRVKRGERVKRGDVIGLCGNSGNSSQPHLHFHLQDGSGLLHDSWGIDAVFSEVVVTRGTSSSLVKNYSFLKGDRIAPP